MMIPAATTPQTKARLQAMLDPLRTDRLPQYRRQRHQQAPTSAGPVMRPMLELSIEDRAELQRLPLCEHRGDYAGMIGCNCQASNGLTPVFRCTLNPDATLCSPLKATAYEGVAACANCPSRREPVTVAPCSYPGVEKRWLGTTSRKSWEYPVQLVIAHWNTPDILKVGIELWRAQTVRPFICVVDTGSDPDVVAELIDMEAPDIEFHFLRARDYRHGSSPVATALDIAAARCLQPKQLHTHTDVFPRRRDVVEELAALCSDSQPVVGYEISPRDHVPGMIANEWRGMVGHTLTMLDMATIRQLGVRWDMETVHEQFGWPRRPDANNDTEVGFNLLLRHHGIQPWLIGHDTNHEHFVDGRIDHFRSYSGSLLYSSDYHRQASQWAQQALADANARLAAWRD